MGNRLLQLDADSRQCLELLRFRAGRSTGPLIQAAGSRTRCGADNLRERNLLRSRSGEVEEYEIYHARMTRGVLMHVSDARLKELHRRLAVAQEEIGADAETLYHHYHQSGERTRAAAFAVAAAGQAARALAFDRAANLYARALEDSPPDHESLRDIRVRLGDALAMAGRGVEAAGAYLAAAEGAPQPEQIRLRERAMGQFFRTGRFDEGLATLRAILPALRLKWPETSQQAVAALVLRRLQLRIRGLSFRERDVASVPSDDLVRIDACLSVSTGLSVVENVRAALFQTRALLWALDTGEPLRVTRAMVLEAAFSALGGSRTRKRTEQLFARVSELTARVDKPDTHALAMVARGVALHLNGECGGRWRFSSQREQLLSQHASEVVRSSTTPERLRCTASRRWAVPRGEPAAAEPCRRRGESRRPYAKSMFAFRRSLMHVVADDPASAKGVSAQAVSDGPVPASMRRIMRPPVPWQRGLYRGAPEDVREHLDRIQGPLQRSRFLRLQMVFVEVAHLRARTYLALAAKNIESAAMLKAAAREAEGLERQGVAWGTALAMLVRAGIATTTSDTAKAAELLAAAEQALSSADLVIHQLAARYRAVSSVREPRASCSWPTRTMKCAHAAWPIR